jgi:hypothetical protein
MKDDLSAPLLPEEGCACRARGGGSRVASRESRVTRSRAVLLVALLACTGCGIQPQIFEGNYLTYEHAFTDAAVAEVGRNAEAMCRQRGRVAVPASRACSLTQCTTSYQCATDEAIVLPAEKRK